MSGYDEGFPVPIPDEEPLQSSLPLAQTPTEPIPALRDIQAQFVQVGKEKSEPTAEDADNRQTIVVLEDPEGLAVKPAALSPLAYAMASLFDGRRSAQAVSEVFAAQYGQTVVPSQVLDLQRELDQAMLLFSTRFEQIVKTQLENYLAATVRPSVHAGSAYPDNGPQLLEKLRSFFAPPDGPGDLDKIKPEEIARTDTVRALVVPHIDLRVGGATYAHAYRELLCHSQAELIVVLGVAHQNPGDGLFNVSRKDFNTPLGLVRTDQALSGRLQRAADVPAGMAEMAHRTEHSVEFQAVLLKALFSEHRRRDFQIVPVLCGPVEKYLAQERNMLNVAPFKRFVAALREALAHCGRKWCVLCSVDFSHVGPEFGHSTMIDRKLLPPVERADRKLLRLIETRDPKALYGEIERNQNSRHVDAVVALLTMLEVCREDLQGARLLHYDQMLKDNTHSAVSYAAMAFDGPLS